MSPAALIPESERLEGVVPAGYRLLVRIPNVDGQMKKWANLHMPETTRQLEEAAQLVCQVLAIGSDAYKDSVKFPTGPWCQVGDYVMMRAYVGTRFSLRSEDGRKLTYGLINDDTVQAVLPGEMAAEIERA